MKKRITVTKECREFIAKAFRVTERTVFNALSGERDNDLARRIRKLALQRGGVEMDVYEDFETIHDANGYMYQHFPNGAMIEIHKASGMADVIYNGELKVRYSNVTVSQINEIQTLAAGLR